MTPPCPNKAARKAVLKRLSMKVMMLRSLEDSNRQIVVKERPDDDAKRLALSGLSGSIFGGCHGSYMLKTFLEGEYRALRMSMGEDALACVAANCPHTTH